MAARLPRFDFGRAHLSIDAARGRLGRACRAAAAGDLGDVRDELDGAHRQLRGKSRALVLAAAIAAGAPGERAAELIAQMGDFDTGAIACAAARARSPEALAALYRLGIGGRCAGELAFQENGFITLAEPAVDFLLRHELPEPFARDIDPDGEACVGLVLEHERGLPCVALAHAWLGPERALAWARAHARALADALHERTLRELANSPWGAPYAEAIAAGRGPGALTKPARRQ